MMAATGAGGRHDAAALAGVGGRMIGLLLVALIFSALVGPQFLGPRISS